MTLPPGIGNVTLGVPGLPGLCIENDFCRATVAMQGAQLLSFEPAGGVPLLWLSPAAVYQAGKAIRGGIPLCFPWFGPHPDDPGRPAHGFARSRPWRLDAAEASTDGHVLHFSLADDAATRQLWPHAFRASLSLHLGRRLHLQFGVENRDHAPFDFTFALHSYFPVSDIAHARVQGLDGVGYIDQLDPAPRRRQQGEIVFGAETDRIYLGGGGAYRIVDGNRSTVIRAEGCRSAVVWNPWAEKAARLADMAPGDWRRMLCVECGNVADDHCHLLPGETRRFALEIG